MMFSKESKEAFKDYLSIIIDVGTIIGLGIGLIYGLYNFFPYNYSSWDSLIGDIFHIIVIPTLSSALLAMLIINIPLYGRKKIKEHIIEIHALIDSRTRTINENLKECPRLFALHTDKGILKKKIEFIDNAKDNHKWILAKYLSKLLSVQLIDYRFHLSGENYSKFASDIIKESKESIILLGSLPPMDWLLLLGTAVDKKQELLNNTLLGDYSLDPDNHSETLKNVSWIKKQRYICLSNLDFENLFLHEKCLKLYNEKNRGIENYFVNFDKTGININPEKLVTGFDPSKKEYMICDNEIAFEWDRTSEMVKISEDTPEEKDFLTPARSIIEKLEFKVEEAEDNNHLTYEQLIRKVIQQKIVIIQECLSKNRISHKYSYLFPNVEELTRGIYLAGRIYGDRVAQALARILPKIVKEKVNIIHIGPGTGHRISSICDIIGSDKIKGYYLVDISPQNLDTSSDILEKRLNGHKVEINTFQIDLYKNFEYETVFKTSSGEVIKNAIVLIPANSSLLGREISEDERDFLSIMIDENNKNTCVITLDKYDEEQFQKIHLEAKEFLFSPLKIFEVPYIKNTAKNNLFYYKYSNNILRLCFKLKNYLDEIGEANLGKYTDAGEEVDWANDLTDSYKSLRAQLYNKEEIQLVSFLKFKEVEDLKKHFSKNFDIENYEEGEDGVIEHDCTFCFALKFKKTK
jgi:hypothetical protein